MHTDQYVDDQVEQLKAKVLDTMHDQLVADDYTHRTDDGKLIVTLDGAVEFEVVLRRYLPDRQPELLDAEQVLDENPWLRTL